MTPASTNRLPAVSLLDVLGSGSQNHLPAHPPQGFAAALKQSPAARKQFEHPSGPSKADSESRDSAAASREDDSRAQDAKSARSAARRKLDKSEAVRKERRERESDEEEDVIKNQIAAPTQGVPKEQAPETSSEVSTTPSDTNVSSQDQASADQGESQTSGASLLPAVIPLVASAETVQSPVVDLHVATDEAIVPGAETIDPGLVPEGSRPLTRSASEGSQNSPAIAHSPQLLPIDAEKAGESTTNTPEEVDNHEPQPEVAEGSPTPIAATQAAPDSLSADGQGTDSQQQEKPDSPQEAEGSTETDASPLSSLLSDTHGPQPETTPAAGEQNTTSDKKPHESAPTNKVSPPPAADGANPAIRLPQNVLSRAEGHRGHAPAAVPVDSARFLSRVAKAFAAAQQRDGEIRLRLSPPELGSLRLQVSVQEGVMTARLETETEAARAHLVNNLPALRERLTEQGIRVERFDIDLMQRPSTGTPDRPGDPQQQHDPQPPHSLRTHLRDSAEPVALPAVGDSWNGQGRLNVII